MKAGDQIEGAALTARDFPDRDLADIVLTGCLIEDAQLSALKAPGARFVRCRILRSRFSHADLREAAFEDCQLFDPEAKAGAAFAFTDLQQARFTRCDLALASFEGSGLYAAEFDDCNLMGAAFPRADFSRSFRRSLVRTAAAFRGCNLGLADLSGARLPGCDLNRSLFREADLSGADLEGADLRHADLFQAALDGARLAGADLRGAEISGLNLLTLATREGMKITADQQYALLSAMGVDVEAG